MLRVKPYYYFIFLGIISLLISMSFSGYFNSNKHEVIHELSLDINIHDTYYVIYYHHFFFLFFLLFIFNFLIYKLIDFFKGKLFKELLFLKVVASAFLLITISYILYKDYNYSPTQEEFWNTTVDYSGFLVVTLFLFLFLLSVVPLVSILTSISYKLKSTTYR